MKFGIIYTAFNCENYLIDSLNPWAKARHDKLDNHEFVICAVSLPFIGFEFDKWDSTTATLRANKFIGTIDELITSTTPWHETDARGEALRYLKAQNVDYVWQIDGDEFFTSEQISNIIKFIEKTNLIVWYKLSYKNYVFDEKTYFTEPFTPARIHKIKTSDFIADRFWDDNNIEYLAHDYNQLDRQFANVAIPKSVAWIKHLTWLSNDRSRAKINYQKARNWVCSFDWDAKEDRLIFNKDYYIKSGKDFPETARDS